MTELSDSEGPSLRSGWRDELDGSLLLVVVGSIVVTVIAGLVQVRYGAYTMSMDRVLDAVFDPAVWFHPRILLTIVLGDGLAHFLGVYASLDGLSDPTFIVWTTRMPRVLIGALVGADLAVSGAVFQAITRNELASPYVLGVSSGAGLAVLLTLVFFAGASTVLPIAAAVGGALAFLLVYVIAWQGGTSPVRLVLAGVVVATIGNALQKGLFFFLNDTGAVRTALEWMTGTLTGVDWGQFRIAVVPTLLIVPIALVAARQLNVLLLGEQTAQSLGMSVERTRFGLSIVAILAAATAVSVAGLVAFVGLVVPHSVRTVLGSDYKRLLLGCVFVGPALVVVADVVARLALSPVQIPVGIVTGLIGGPYFLYLMRRTGRFDGL